MLSIERISDDAYQKQRLVLQDGTYFDLTIVFVPLQKSWFIDSLVYNDFVMNGMRISNNLNMLHQYKNLIPFGLACVSKQDREPSLQEDFSSGASSLYILTPEEVEEYAEFVSGQI